MCSADEPDSTSVVDALDGLADRSSGDHARMQESLSVFERHHEDLVGLAEAFDRRFAQGREARLAEQHGAVGKVTAAQNRGAVKQILAAELRIGVVEQQSQRAGAISGIATGLQDLIHARQPSQFCDCDGCD